MTERESRPSSETGAAQSISAGSLKLNSTLPAQADSAPWRIADLVRLHKDLGLHVFPTGAHKTPLGKWHLGPVDSVAVKPTDDEVLAWASQRPKGWCVLCGGPSAVVTLDVEAAGVEDSTTKGDRIREVLASLPASCKRPSPSGGEHAWLRVIDGPAPRGVGGRLVERLEGTNTEGKPDYTLLAEYRGHLQYALILGHGRGDLPVNFRPHEVTTQELNEIFESLREVSDKKPHIRSRPGRVASGSSELGAGNMTEDLWEIDLDLLPPGPPCRAMQSQMVVFAKTLANGSRHDATLGPVIQLVRLGQQRHQGLVEALGSLKSDYVDLVAPDREGGVQEAEREWSRAQGGALEIVFPGAISLTPDAICDCWISDYRSFMRQDGLFTRQGRAKVTD